MPFKITQRGKNPFYETLVYLRLLLLLKRYQPDVILTFTIKCNIYTGLCRSFLSFKQIAGIDGLGEIFEREGWLTSLICRLYKYSLQKAEMIFFQNEEDLIRLVYVGKCFPLERCKRIPGTGVDLSKFSPNATSSSRSRNKRVFFMFGRLLPKKGYHLFLDVARILHTRYKDEAEFWLLGIEDKSRKESMQLLERVKKYHRMGYVKYMTQTDDVTSVLRNVDVVVLPSCYNEGIPRSLLEAMACGKLLITSDWRGCRYTVDDGVNGFLVKPNDLDSLQKRITDIIHAPSELLVSMGKASRKKAENEFDETIVIEQYLKQIEG